MKHELSRIAEENRLCVTVPEVAMMLGISRNNAYEKVKQGKIPSMRLGNRILVPKVQLIKWVERGGIE